MRVLVGLAVSAALTLTPTAVAVSAAGGGPAPAPAAAAGQVAIVQAVPGADVDVMIDGETVESDVPAGEVLGPYPLSPGEHQVDFSGTGRPRAGRDHRRRVQAPTRTWCCTCRRRWARTPW